MNALQILKEKGFAPLSDLNYCTESGVDYFIGYKQNKAGIAAIIQDESLCLIAKNELREMALTARIKGIESVTLFTNYGLELHSRYDKPEIVGLNRIEKLFTNF